MEVAENRDREAFQPGRPTPERKIPAHDSRTIGYEQRAVRGECGHAGSRREADKFSPVRRKKANRFSDPYSVGLRGTRSPPFSITRVLRFAI